MSRTVKEADLGDAASGAVIGFTIPAARGFSAVATLDLEMTRMAAWQSVEISGKTTTEELIPKGAYTLEVTIAFRSKQSTKVDLSFTMSKGGKTPKSATLSFTGKNGDLALAVVFANIT